MKLKKKLKRKYIFSLGLCLIIYTSIASSQNTTRFSRNWNNLNNWDGGIPTTTSTAIIQHHMHVFNNIAITTGSYYEIQLDERFKNGIYILCLINEKGITTKNSS